MPAIGASLRGRGATRRPSLVLQVPHRAEALLLLARELGLRRSDERLGEARGVAVEPLEPVGERGGGRGVVELLLLARIAREVVEAALLAAVVEVDVEEDAVARADRRPAVAAPREALGARRREVPRRDELVEGGPRRVVGAEQ